MGIGLEIGSAIGGAVGELFKTGYNIWSNQRDFDYQKALQNEVFAREDNAVQRRMKDLEAAGLNPNLAAGSAAGSGAVVGRSSTNQLAGNPVGTALDMASHVQQLRQQRIENEILNNQKRLSDKETKTAELQSVFDRAALYNQLGIKGMVIKFRNGSPYILADDWKMNLDDSPLVKQLDWQLQNNKNSADLLQKDVNFYNLDKVGQYLGQGIQLFSGAGSGYWNFTRRR